MDVQAPRAARRLVMLSLTVFALLIALIALPANAQAGNLNIGTNAPPTSNRHSAPTTRKSSSTMPFTIICSTSRRTTKSSPIWPPNGPSATTA